MLEEIQKALTQDPYFQGIISSYPNQETQETIKDYSVKDGLLHFKGRLCVLAKLKNQVMKEAHEAPLVAHPIYHKMFATLKQTFFWPRIKKDTLEFTRKRLIFQKTKAERIKLTCKLHPHDIPQMKWECISMDFVTRIPKVS